MEKEQITKAALEAAEIVEDVDQEFRGNAFHVIFARLLDEIESSRRNQNTGGFRGTSVKSRVETQDNLSIILTTPLDFSNYSNIVLEGGWAERALVILHVIEEELGIRSLSALELTEVMVKQLRLPNVYRTNVSRALRNAREYFIRNKKGRSYSYMISASGLKYLESISGQK
jgi:hypothetical protein